MYCWVSLSLFLLPGKFSLPFVFVLQLYAIIIFRLIFVRAISIKVVIRTKQLKKKSNMLPHVESIMI